MDKNQYHRALRVIAGIIERAPHVSGCPALLPTGRLHNPGCSCGISDSRNNLVHIAHGLDLDWAGPPENAAPDFCQSCKVTPTLPGVDGLLICDRCRATIPMLLLRAVRLAAGTIPRGRGFAVTLETAEEIGFHVATFDGAACGWIRITENMFAAAPPVYELRLSSIVAVRERE